MSQEQPNNNSLSRMNRGMEIAEKKVICENGDGSFSVPSATVEEVAYLVRMIDGKYLCNCMDFKQRHEEVGACKHIHAVKFWIAFQVELKQAPKPKIFADDSIQCDKCGSIRVIRYGVRANKQAYLCKNCKHKFTPSLLKKAKYSPETVSLCLDLYFSGTSLAKTARILNNQFDMKLGKVTVYRWIQKFVPKISEYVNSLEPQLSDTWHADELFVKFKDGISYNGKNNLAFLWNVMDRKTRFLLASKLSRFRDAYGAIESTKEALANAHGQAPDHIFVDSLQAYVQAHRRFLPNTQRHANSGIKKPHATNNRIERLNGTLRERVKVQRGWKQYSSKIAEGERIHYNFVKPHQALEGMTPAQRAGIGVDSKNKWLELLEQSIKTNRQ